LSAFQEARRRLIEPRIGNQNKVSYQQAQAQVQLFVLTSLLVGVMFLILIGLFSVPDFLSKEIIDLLRSNFLLIMGFVFSLILVCSAWVLRAKRFYLYAAISFAIMYLAHAIVLSLWQALAILGVSVGISGTLILFRFLNMNPAE
jgi:hypothetical protein